MCVGIDISPDNLLSFLVCVLEIFGTGTENTILNVAHNRFSEFLLNVDVI